jgi:hypothetical protein
MRNISREISYVTIVNDPGVAANDVQLALSGEKSFFLLIILHSAAVRMSFFSPDALSVALKRPAGGDPLSFT